MDALARPHMVRSRDAVLLGVPLAQQFVFSPIGCPIFRGGLRDRFPISPTVAHMCGGGAVLLSGKRPEEPGFFSDFEPSRRRLRCKSRCLISLLLSPSSRFVW